MKSNLIGLLFLSFLAAAIGWIFWNNAKSHQSGGQVGAPVTLMAFGAKWCGPCRGMKPVVRELAAQLGDCLEVIEIDVDSAPQLARKYNVGSIPCFVVLNGGVEVTRRTGSMPKEQLRALTGL